MSIFSKLEREIKKGINRLGDSVKGEVNKLGNNIKGEVNNIGNKVKSEVEGVANKAKGEVENAANTVVHELQEQVKLAGNEIEDLAEKAIDELEDDVQALLQKIFAEMSKQGFKKALSVLKKAESIGETALADAGFGINLSFLSLDWNDIGGRVGDIRQKVEEFIKKPPVLSRQYVIDLINAFAPDTVGVSLDVKLAALVVTSDDLAVGFNFHISTPAFLEAGDDILDAMGL